MPAEPAHLRAPALRDYQARTFQALLRAVTRYRGATLTVMFPRQAGKNEVAAVLVAALLQANAAKGGSIVVCAPTARPQAEISRERAHGMLTATAALLPLAGQPRAGGGVLEVGNARAIFLSASPLAHVAGHTASLALIADEAQDIDAGWFNRQFRPMAASTGAPTVLFGTAWDGRSLLERAAAANRERDSRGPQGADSWLPWHYEVGWREVAAARPAYGEYVRAERARLGRHHPLYLSQYELVASDAAGRLLPPARLAALEGGYGRLSVPASGARYVAGLDFGGEGSGADRTILTVAGVREERCEVVEHVAWQSAAYATVVSELIALAGRWRLERLCADATGMGAPLVAQLERALGSPVEGVVFSAQSKSSLGYALIAAAETGRLALYRDDGSPEAAACRAELYECEAVLRPGGLLAWGARSGHDDYVASLALCLRAAAALGPARLAQGRRANR